MPDCKKTFYIKPDTDDEINYLARTWGCSRSQALANAVFMIADQTRDFMKGEDTSDEEKDTAHGSRC